MQDSLARTPALAVACDMAHCANISPDVEVSVADSTAAVDCASSLIKPVGTPPVPALASRAYASLLEDSVDIKSSLRVAVAATSDAAAQLRLHLASAPHVTKQQDSVVVSSQNNADACTIQIPRQGASPIPRSTSVQRQAPRPHSSSKRTLALPSASDQAHADAEADSAADDDAETDNEAASSDANRPQSIVSAEAAASGSAAAAQKFDDLVESFVDGAEQLRFTRADAACQRQQKSKQQHDDECRDSCNRSEYKNKRARGAESNADHDGAPCSAHAESALACALTASQLRKLAVEVEELRRLGARDDDPCTSSTSTALTRGGNASASPATSVPASAFTASAEAARRGAARADPELVLRLLMLLDVQLRDGVQVHLCVPAAPSSITTSTKSSSRTSKPAMEASAKSNVRVGGVGGNNGFSSAAARRVNAALDAAIVAIGLMAEPTVDRRLLHSEVIEHVTQLASHTVMKLLLPVLDGMQRLRLQQRQLELDSEQKCIAFVRPQILQGTSWRTATLFGKLGTLMDTVRLEDRQVEALCSASLALFGADAAPTLPRSERADAEMAAAAAAATKSASKSSTLTKVGKACKHGKIALSQQNDSARVSLEQLQLASLRFLQCTFTHVQYSALRRYLVDELVLLMAKLPTSKAALHGYRLPGSNEQYIQMHTALLLLLMQASVPDRPPPPLCVTGSDENAAEAIVPPSLWIGRRFMGQLLTRCAQFEDGKDDGSEWRARLNCLIDDVLAVLVLPEWPAAPVIVQLLTVRLRIVLRSSVGCTVEDSDIGSGDDWVSTCAANAKFCAAAVDMLGKICARVRTVQRQARDRPVLLPTVMPVVVKMDARPEDDGEDARCICNGSGDATSCFMLDCDQCHRWFHGRCVGVRPNDVPHRWVCDDCILRGAVEDQREKLEEARNREVKEATNISIDSVVKSRKRKHEPKSNETNGQKLPNPKKMKVVELKEALSSRGLDTSGLKSTLQQRLKEALGREGKGVNEKRTANQDTKQLAEQSKADAGCDDEVAIAEDGLQCQSSELDLEPDDVFRQLLLNALTARACDEPSLLHARRWLLWHWIGSEDARIQNLSNGSKMARDARRRARALLVAQWEVPEHSHSRVGAAAAVHSDRSVQRSAILRFARQLAVTNTAQHSCGARADVTSPFAAFDTNLLSLLSLLDGEQRAPPTLRAKALKAVSHVVDADPVPLMRLPRLHQAVRSRFLDENISVREAAVTLVGRYIVTLMHAGVKGNTSNEDSDSGADGGAADEVIDSYFDAVLKRLHDTGVSVRKSVVRITHAILLSRPSDSRCVEACVELVSRIADPEEEDTIKVIVRKTFSTLWFSSDIVVPSERRRRAAAAAVATVAANKSVEHTSSNTAEIMPVSGSHREIDSGNESASRVATPAALDNITMCGLIPAEKSSACRGTKRQSPLSLLETIGSATAPPTVCNTPSTLEAIPAPQPLELSTTDRDTTLSTTPLGSWRLNSLGGRVSDVNRVRAQATQIVSVVAAIERARRGSAGRSALEHSWLKDLLSGLLLEQNDEDDDSGRCKRKRSAATVEKERSGVVKRCKQLVEAIFCLMREVGAAHSDTTAADSRRSQPFVPRFACLAAARTFGEVAPALLLPHIVTLTPLLPAIENTKDNRDRARMAPPDEREYQLAADMLRVCLPLLSRADTELLSVYPSLWRQLMLCATSPAHCSSQITMRAAVRCMTAIATLPVLSEVQHAWQLQLAARARFCRVHAKDNECAGSDDDDSCDKANDTCGDGSLLLLELQKFYEKARQWEALDNGHQAKFGKQAFPIARVLTAAGTCTRFINYDGEDDEEDSAAAVAAAEQSRQLRRGGVGAAVYDLAARLMRYNIHAVARFGCLPGNDSSLRQRQAIRNSIAAMEAVGLTVASRPRLLMRAQEEGIIAAALSDETVDDDAAAEAAALLWVAPVGCSQRTRHERQERALRRARAQPLLPLRQQGLKSLLETLNATEQQGNAQHALAARRRVASRVLRGVNNSCSEDDDDDEDMLTDITDDRDGAADAGAVVRGNMRSVLALAIHPQPHLRAAALAVLSAGLKHGVLHPASCAAHIIALQADRQKGGVGSLARRLCAWLADRWPADVRKSTLRAIPLAFELWQRQQKASLSDNSSESSCLIETRFATVYRECIQPKRAHREAFLRGCFDLAGCSASDPEQQQKHKTATEDGQAQSLLMSLPGQNQIQNNVRRTKAWAKAKRAMERARRADALRAAAKESVAAGSAGSNDIVSAANRQASAELMAFVLRIVARLPFKTEDEVMFVISTIARTVAVAGDCIDGPANTLSKELEARGLLDGKNAHEQQQQSAVIAAQPHANDDADRDLACHVQRVYALHAAMCLKSHLQEQYSLSNAKITAYDNAVAGTKKAIFVRRTAEWTALTLPSAPQRQGSEIDADFLLAATVILRNFGRDAAAMSVAVGLSRPSRKRQHKASSQKRNKAAPKKSKEAIPKKSKKSTPKKKRKRCVVAEEDDGDDSDDSDWTG